MNQNSLLCKFISEHPDNYEQVLKDEYRIGTIIDERYPYLRMFKYGIKVKFKDPMVCEARGIIIDIEKLEVVCWPFNKFFEDDDTNAAQLDKATTKVTKKMDGSMIKLWWNERENSFMFSTMGMINADKAPLDPKYVTDNCKTLMDAITTTRDFNNLVLYMKHVTAPDIKHLTLMFELVSKYNIHEIEYWDIEVGKLYLIGVKNNQSGKEMTIDDFLNYVGEKYYLLFNPVDEESYLDGASIERIIEEAGKLNHYDNGYGTISNLSQEGFVACDGNFNRVKVKSPAYLLKYNPNTRTSTLTLISLANKNLIELDRLICDHTSYKWLYCSHYIHHVNLLKNKFKSAAKLFFIEKRAYPNLTESELIRNYTTTAVKIFDMSIIKIVLGYIRYCKFEEKDEQIAEIYLRENVRNLWFFNNIPKPIYLDGMKDIRSILCL